MNPAKDALPVIDIDPAFKDGVVRTQGEAIYTVFADRVERSHKPRRAKKLTYSAADRTGFVDNGVKSAAFTQALTLSFACDMIWYEPLAGHTFLGKGYGRQALTEAQCTEIESVIATIVI